MASKTLRTTAFVLEIGYRVTAERNDDGTVTFRTLDGFAPAFVPAECHFATSDAIMQIASECNVRISGARVSAARILPLAEAYKGRHKAFMTFDELQAHKYLGVDLSDSFITNDPSFEAEEEVAA